MWRREFSVLDGLFTFNVFWETFGEIGIFFRTYDNNNYYVLKVNPTATGKTISVWKNSNGRMVKLSNSNNFSRKGLFLRGIVMVLFLPQFELSASQPADTDGIEYILMLIYRGAIDRLLVSLQSLTLTSRGFVNIFRGSFGFTMYGTFIFYL